jgi:hypothetical protein
MNDATCAATGAGGDVLTLEKIRAASRMLDENEAANRRMFAANAAAGLFNPFGELRIKESPLASRKVPARIHKWGRGQSFNYHVRIQKKWIKRYGVKRESCVFVLEGGLYGLGSMFVVPPGMLQALRDAAVTGTGIHTEG